MNLKFLWVFFFETESTYSFSKCCRSSEEEIIMKKVNLSWDDWDCPAEVQEKGIPSLYIGTEIWKYKEVWQGVVLCGYRVGYFVCVWVEGQSGIMVLKWFRCNAQEFGIYPVEYGKIFFSKKSCDYIIH